MRKIKDKIIQEIVEIAHIIYQKGFVSATDGNISARLPNGNILCTPTSVNKGEIKKSHIVEIDENGNLIYGIHKPSTEIKMHLFIYKNRDDVNAIVHAHPPFATSFAVAGLSLENYVLPEVIVNLGKIPLAKYATPSTDEVAQSIQPYVKNHDAFLLQNHGAVTLGVNLKDAFYKMEKLEHYAMVILLSRVLGGEKVLSNEDILKLAEISLKSYGKQIKI
ncbi:class II aldolase/adducin family protein [Candidatus Chrysopegis kryptomonas]|jgi:L-fuculose-phosphate aldolase|uniref:L-fuculose-phosphate aldolase n=1 Tax=Candidatus Chryseopegocella kryptomonas TaxID=1633643 RepID=A0A0P1P2W2_9BACT|nr:class II aldolase/adducin family protein [Candidatus Chrysopegis kryptomonas]CUT05495.1 L-fuculose-phosphate aldolase [Candidatus Chrysopegis kryptomonas]